MTPSRPRRGAADPAAARLPRVLRARRGPAAVGPRPHALPAPGHAARGGARLDVITARDGARPRALRRAAGRRARPAPSTATSYSAFVPLDVPPAELAERVPAPRGRDGGDDRAARGHLGGGVAAGDPRAPRRDGGARPPRGPVDRRPRRRARVLLGAPRAAVGDPLRGRVLPRTSPSSEFADLYRDLFGGGRSMPPPPAGFPTRTFEVGVRPVAPEPRRAALARGRRGARDRGGGRRAGRARRDRGGAPRCSRSSSAPRGVRPPHRDMGPATPSFIEDPAPVIKVLKDYATQPDSASPGHELDRLARERAAGGRRGAPSACAATRRRSSPSSRRCYMALLRLRVVVDPIFGLSLILDVSLGCGRAWPSAPAA